MFRIMKELRESALRGVDLPTLVFLNPEDEIVNHRLLIQWIDESRLSRWRVAFVRDLRPSISPSYHHLMIDQASMGAEAWTELATGIRDFLR
jgi:predicted membrane-bound dolichyl-phosphate-mannose-protein mannosyltransferase